MYFSGGLLATTMGVDGAARIFANVTKIAVYGAQGKKAGDASQTNLGGLLGAGISDELGSETQLEFQDANNVLILLMGNPADDIFHFMQASTSIGQGRAASSFFIDARDSEETFDELNRNSNAYHNK